MEKMEVKRSAPKMAMMSMSRSSMAPRDEGMYMNKRA